MDNQLKLNIGSHLKNLRSQRSWSLDIASQKTGVSKAMLGQIERGESSPTIATLWKIATGFEVSFSSFIEEIEPNREIYMHRKLALQQLHQQDDKIKTMPIFPFDKQLGFEIFVIELLPGCTHVSPPHQKGVLEHVISVRGTIEVLVSNKWHQVHAQEGFRFAADVEHGYRNLSDTAALFHNIIHY